MTLGKSTRPGDVLILNANLLACCTSFCIVHSSLDYSVKFLLSDTCDETSIVPAGCKKDMQTQILESCSRVIGFKAQSETLEMWKNFDSMLEPACLKIGVSVEFLRLCLSDTTRIDSLCFKLSVGYKHLCTEEDIGQNIFINDTRVHEKLIRFLLLSSLHPSNIRPSRPIRIVMEEQPCLRLKDCLSLQSFETELMKSLVRLQYDLSYAK